jgi:hypothetical protein
MTGSDSRSKSFANLFPRRCLVHPKNGEQRTFIQVASHSPNDTPGVSPDPPAI